MGANPNCYFTLYNANVALALAALREREFSAGRYNPALLAAVELFFAGMSVD